MNLKQIGILTAMIIIALMSASCELIGGDTGANTTDDTVNKDSNINTKLDVTASVGPCEGYRTEALLLDQEGTIWAGCGSDPGLFKLTAGATAFASVAGYEDYLIYDLEQADGLLYVGGGLWEGKDILKTYDPATGVSETSLKFSGAAPFMRMSKIQNVALATDGDIMVDSLNGNYIGWFHGAEWTEGYYWNEGALQGNDKGYQMSQLIAYGDRFYACGSVINQPPTVFLPSTEPEATYHFKPVELAGPDRDGALEGLAVLGEDHMVAVGVNETTNHGVIFTCTKDCTEAASWVELDVEDDLGVEGGAKLWAVTFDATGTLGLAVGDLFPGNTGGYVLITSDGGLTWQRAAGTFNTLSAVLSLGNGEFLVAGGDHELATIKVTQ